MGNKKRREPGEYTFPEDSMFKDVRAYAPERRYFLNLVFVKFPEANEDLLDNVVPKLYEIVEKNRKKNKEINWSVIKEDIYFNDLKKAIVDLKKKYNLIEADKCKQDWISILILDEAYRLMKKTKYKNKIEHSGKVNSKEVDYIPFKEKLDFKVFAAYFWQKNAKELTININMAWNPISETKKEAREKIAKEIKKELERICEYMEEKGCKKNKSRKDDYEKLVLYQIKEMSHSDIATKFTTKKKIVHEKLIQKTVERRAKKIGLKKRTQI